MIARLEGLLQKKSTDSLIIDIRGVGYEVFVPLTTFYSLPEENENVCLHIHTHVKEDAIILFGFHTLLEKKIFRLLISVSGIGPKLAINILSGTGAEELVGAIAQGDVVKLQSIPGVGKKTAERISLELKDKAGRIADDSKEIQAKVSVPEHEAIFDDALSALLNLGYPAKYANRAVEKALSESDKEGLSLEQVIKEALRQIV